MIEEANAQGVATRAMEIAGLQVDDSGWGNMKEYPMAHLDLEARLALIQLTIVQMKINLD